MRHRDIQTVYQLSLVQAIEKKTHVAAVLHVAYVHGKARDAEVTASAELASYVYIRTLLAIAL